MPVETNAENKKDTSAAKVEPLDKTTGEKEPQPAAANDSKTSKGIESLLLFQRQPPVAQPTVWRRCNSWRNAVQ